MKKRVILIVVLLLAILGIGYVYTSIPMIELEKNAEVEINSTIDPYDYITKYRKCEKEDVSIDSSQVDLTKIGGNLDKEEQEAKQLRDDFFKKQIEKKEDKNEKQVLTIDHTKLVFDDDYEFPPINILGLNKDVEKIVDFVKSNGTATYSDDVLESIEKDGARETSLAVEADNTHDNDGGFSFND